MGGRGSGIAGNPVLIGAATVLVVLVAVFLSYNANQGLPFVPTYALKARDAERREPRARQRGADRRHARRLGRQDQRRAPRRRHEHRRARPQARALGQAAAEGLDGADPAALGARPEVRRADARHVRRGLRGRRHDPARAGHAGARRVRRVREHVRRGHARRRAGQPARASATRSPAAARASTRRSARSGRCCATSSRSRRTCRARRRTCRASSASWPTPRAIVAPGGREPGAAVREPRHDVRRAARGRAPVHPGVDLRGPRDARRRDRGLPRPAPVPRQHRGPVPRAAARACAALRDAAPRTSPTRSRSARRRCCARRRSTAGSRRCSPSSRRSPRTRSCRAASAA